MGKSVIPLLLAVLAAGLVGCAGATPEPSPVERGEYLVATMGCNDCHTPKKMGEEGPEPDETRLLSGHPEKLQALTAPVLPEPWTVATTPTLTAWAGPWGISYASNLTPDVETGLGSWSEEAFMEAMRSGLHMAQGRPILPPHPREIGQATDADLRAIFAYLGSIAAIRNEVPDPLIVAPGAEAE